MVKKNKLTLCRGIPSSGKTTLAKKIVDADETGNTVMVSADDFYTHDDGSYNFDFSLIKMAHAYCQGVAFYHLARGKNVVVHNTFTQKWEVGPYLETAISCGYEWDIIEPKTKWKSDPSVCAEKNTHNVPLASIEKMAARWETTKSIVEYFNKERFAAS